MTLLSGLAFTLELSSVPSVQCSALASCDKWSVDTLHLKEYRMHQAPMHSAVLCQVAAEASGDFDLGDPSELRELVSPTASAAPLQMPAPQGVASSAEPEPPFSVAPPSTPPRLPGYSPTLERSMPLAHSLLPVQVRSRSWHMWAFQA